MMMSLEIYCMVNQTNLKKGNNFAIETKSKAKVKHIMKLNKYTLWHE